MTVITGGHTAPRDGAYKVSKAGQDHYQIEIDGRTHTHVNAKAGDKLPGGADVLFDVGELRAGEVAPKDGVWVHMPTGTEHPLKAGATFPEAEGGDYIWVREK